MKKAVIYGSAQLGVQIAWHIKWDYEILGFIDSDSRKFGKNLCIDSINYPIYPPQELQKLEFDKVFIGSEVPIYIEQITDTLKHLGIQKEKFDFSLTFIPHYARINFIKTFAYKLKEKNINGAVAELGVFRGDTARHINSIFKDKECYLLDTFEGFNAQDCDTESQKGLSKASTSDFSKTSIAIVKEKMPHLEKCHFIQGHFPKTSNQIPKNEKFCFVNIDVDLYQPILEGLKYFYPKLIRGGGILVHDYFHPYYTGVKLAVDEYCAALGLTPLPIGDSFSIFLLKHNKESYCKIF